LRQVFEGVHGRTICAAMLVRSQKTWLAVVSA
jgi:hypothetical protein